MASRARSGIVYELPSGGQRILVYSIGILAAAIPLSLLSLAFWATHPPRARSRRSPTDQGLPFDAVEFLAGGDIRIRGWWIPADQPKGVVILCHGHPDSRERMLGRACRLNKAGFHTLLFDFRALGESGGAVSTLGAEEHEEVEAATRWVRCRSDCIGLEIGVLGLSMGGAAALQAAASEPTITAVATHGTYATLAGAIEQRLRRLLGPVGPALMPAARSLLGLWIHRPLDQVSPAAAASLLGNRPLLVIHGGADHTIPPDHANQLVDRASGPVQCHVLPGASHAGVPEAQRALYDDLVSSFFLKHLVTTPNREGQPD